MAVLLPVSGLCLSTPAGCRRRRRLPRAAPTPTGATGAIPGTPQPRSSRAVTLPRRRGRREASAAGRRRQVSVGITAADSPSRGPGLRVLTASARTQLVKSSSPPPRCSGRLAELDERVQLSPLVDPGDRRRRRADLRHRNRPGRHQRHRSRGPTCSPPRCQAAAVMGMSMGEIAAAYAAGGLSAETPCRSPAPSRLMGEGEKSLPKISWGPWPWWRCPPTARRAQCRRGIHPDRAGVYAGTGMTPWRTRDSNRAVEKLEAKVSSPLLNARAPAPPAQWSSARGARFETAASSRSRCTPLFSSVDPAHCTTGETSTTRTTAAHDRQPVYFQDATEAAFAHGTQPWSRSPRTRCRSWA